MVNSLCVEKSESKLKRLSLLPRIGVSIDFAGRQFSYRHVPIIETLVNVAKKGFSMDNYLATALQQLNEVTLPEVKMADCGPKKKSPAKRRAKSKAKA